MLNSKEISLTYNVDENVVEKALNNLANGEVSFVGLSGKIASGKDTIAQLVFGSDDNNVFYSHFAKALKLELQQIFDIVRQAETFFLAFDQIKGKMLVDDVSAMRMCDLLFDEVRENPELTAYIKTPNVRLALQYWGTDVRRKQDDNYWVKKTFEIDSIFEKLAEKKNVVLIDARFVNEMDSIVDCSGKAIRLDVSPEEQSRRVAKRDNVDFTEEARNHFSETALDDYEKFNIRILTDNKEPENIAKFIKERL